MLGLADVRKGAEPRPACASKAEEEWEAEIWKVSPEDAMAVLQLSSRFSSPQQGIEVCAGGEDEFGPWK